MRFRRSRKRSRKKMETFWFFWLRLRCAYDSAYDSDFLFSQGHKRSYHSTYDSYSDSVARENQPRRNHVLFTWRQPRKTGRKVRKHSSISGAAVYVFRFSRFINSKALWYTRMFSIVLSLWSRCNYFCKPRRTFDFWERICLFFYKREWSRCSSFLVSEKLRVESPFA